MVKRVATAVFLTALVAGVLIWAPLWLFKLLILALVLGGLNEYYRLVLPRDRFSFIAGSLFSMCVAGALIFSGLSLWLFPFFLVLLFLLIMAHMAHSTLADGVIEKIGLTLFGAAYLGCTLPAFVWMRESEHGIFMIVATIVIVAMGDSFAYGAGKTIGRHKMSPLISPNKTYEGFVASFFGGVVGAAICWQIFWRELPFWLILFLGVTVALIGALGDLAESLIKRAYHVKDSGNILPGHGGVLDRLDALIFAAPFVYFVFRFLGFI